MDRHLIDGPRATRSRWAAVLLLAAFALMAGQALSAQVTLDINNNFAPRPGAATYFSDSYADEQVWLYFLNSGGHVTYTAAKGGANLTVADAASIKLSTVKGGKFTLAVGCDSTKVFAGLGSTDPFSGDNGPGLFDENVPYALAEWTIKGDAYDNVDVTYEDTFSFPTRLTVKDANGNKTDQCTFKDGTGSSGAISALGKTLPDGPVGPNLVPDNNLPVPGDPGWGPFVPTVSGNKNASRCIGSSKFWISGPDDNHLRSEYIYAPTLNAYLKYLKDNEPTLFGRAIKGWFIDFSGNGGYSGYLSITGSDQSYGLHIHHIRVGTNPSAANKWKADPDAGTAATGDFTVTANNAEFTFPPDPTTKVKGLWTDTVIYSGAAAIGDFWSGPVITGTGDFANGGARMSIVPTMIASVSASMATGLLGSQLYTKKVNDKDAPGATMYWFNTMTRDDVQQKLFDKAWPKSQLFFDPFWETMGDLTHQQGYLSPFNDRWAKLSPDYTLKKNYTITWELGLPSTTGLRP
jgi:hypothetical protein